MQWWYEAAQLVSEYRRGQSLAREAAGESAAIMEEATAAAAAAMRG